MAAVYLQKMRLFSRNVRLVLLFDAIYGLGFLGIFGVLFNLYLLRLGYGPEFIGVVNSAFMLVSVVASLPAGVLGGRWGARRTMIAGVALGLVGLGLLPMAEFVPRAFQDGWIMVTYSLVGLGFALWVANVLPFLMKATTPEERDHAFSAFMALMPLGSFVGSLIGGALPGLFASALEMSLDGPAPYRYPLFIAAVLQIAELAVLLAAREEEATDTPKTVSQAGRAPVAVIAVAALVVLLQLTASAGAETFFNVYLDAGLGESAARVGTLAAVAQLLAVPASLVVPLLMARWDKRHLITLGALAMALSLLPLALIPHWAAAGLGFIGVFALGMMWRSVIPVYVLQLVSLRWQTTMSGAFSAAMSLSYGVMALAGGYIIAALGYRSLFLTGAGVTAAGALIFWTYSRVPRGELGRCSAPDAAE